MSFETITSKLLDSMKKEIKREEHMNTINNEIIKPIVDKVLEQLFTLGSGSNQYMQVAAIVYQKLDELKGYLQSVKSDGVQNAYKEAFVQKIEAFQKNPKGFKRLNAPKIPDGSPIGSQYQCK